MSIGNEINQLPIAGPLTGNELIVGQQDANGVRMTLYQALSLGTITIAAAPTAFTATAISASEINLSWTSTGDNFILEMNRDNSGAWQEIYSGATASYNNIELYQEENYFYRVKSQKAGEFDSEWAYVNATTLTPS